MSERDSPRDQLIVTFFLLTIVGLFLTHAIRTKYVCLTLTVERQLNKG
jgi:hypothetical protein